MLWNLLLDIYGGITYGEHEQLFYDQIVYFPLRNPNQLSIYKKLLYSYKTIFRQSPFCSARHIYSPRTVQLFQLTCWPLPHKVPTSTNSLVELMNMVERWRQKAMGPVCVVSPDGRSRAGVYCAANACIEWVINTN